MADLDALTALNRYLEELLSKEDFFGNITISIESGKIVNVSPNLFTPLILEPLNPFLLNRLVEYCQLRGNEVIS